MCHLSRIVKSISARRGSEEGGAGDIPQGSRFRLCKSHDTTVCLRGTHRVRKRFVGMARRRIYEAPIRHSKPPRHP